MFPYIPSASRQIHTQSQEPDETETPAEEMFSISISMPSKVPASSLKKQVSSAVAVPLGMLGSPPITSSAWTPNPPSSPLLDRVTPLSRTESPKLPSLSSSPMNSEEREAKKTGEFGRDIIFERAEIPELTPLISPLSAIFGGAPKSTSFEPVSEKEISSSEASSEEAVSSSFDPTEADLLRPTPPRSGRTLNNPLFQYLR